MSIRNKYYVAMADSSFEEIKSKAVKLWGLIGDEDFEKRGQVSGIKNVRDNGLYIIAMFDILNQRVLLNYLSKETRKEIFERVSPETFGYNLPNDEK